jgi:hypothetical protein
MKFTPFRRHYRKTCDSANRYDPRCKCPLWVQFVWRAAPGWQLQVPRRIALSGELCARSLNS